MLGRCRLFNWETLYKKIIPPTRDLQNSDVQLKINHLPGLFAHKLLFCRLRGVLQEDQTIILKQSFKTEWF
jgi:hypothetical protein